jgi:signal peptidase I
MARNEYSMAARNSYDRKPEEGIWETVKVILQALAIAFFVRTFLYQPFNIPSGSMYPTLKVGDYLFVSKLSYGYGKYSFNFSLGAFGNTWVKCCPVDFEGRKVLADTPQRGDVAVFKLPTDTEIDYIKRVIGLPGDRIQVKDGVLFINDIAVKKDRIDDYVDPSRHVGNLDGGLYPQYQETLPNGVTYKVLDSDTNGQVDNTDVYVVPAGHYFMMGDNRDNSQDSRFLTKVGFVPLENFMGRADIIFFSLKPETTFWKVWELPFGIRWGRFFNLL